MTESSKAVAGFERHAITVLTMVIVALILWVGNGVQQTQVHMAALQVEIAYIKDNMNEDNGKFQNIERRLDAIEREIRTLQVTK